jgi:hypothetical protein
MKWSIIVGVVVVLAAVGGGAYYVIQHEIRVEMPAPQTSSDRDKSGTRATEEMGTYKDAKHPSFPGPNKKE